jgi:hypothetical protein
MKQKKTWMLYTEIMTDVFHCLRHEHEASKFEFIRTSDHIVVCRPVTRQRPINKQLDNSRY